MEGVTHPALRDLMVKLGGLHLVCTEFVRITQAAVHPALMRKAVRKSPGCPLSVQVMGNDEQQLATAAQLVEAAGADVVDINLGCPMPRVVRKGVGAALLKEPALLSRIMRRMRGGTRGLLSAKIRAGFETSDDAVATALRVEAEGVDFITVHPRRRADFYRGVADWRIIAEIRQALTIPVVGNGDVWYAKDAFRMQQETGADAVMIGRPALRNPWIFVQIEQHRRGLTPMAPSGQDLFEHISRLAAEWQSHFKQRRAGGIGPFKEHLRYLARAVDASGDFGKRALRLDSIDSILSLCDLELAPRSADSLDLLFEGHLAFERSGGT